MSESNGLPKGWAEATLGDVLRIIRGVSYKKEQASSAPRASFMPLLRATNIGMELDFDDLVYVPTSCVDQEQMLVAGDIVVASSSGSKTVVGKASRLTADWHGSFGAFCMGLRVVPPVDSQYICYFMQTHEYRHQISELASGSNINNLRRDHIESFPFRLAPLPEQHRIVATIEELFSHLDAAVASLQRAKANLKRYRASVLKSAVEGRLTEDWRKEHPQAEDGQMLLDRILRERREKWERDQLAKFKENGKEPPKNWQSKYEEPAAPDASELPELPEGWVWATVEQLSVVVRGSSPRPAGDPRYFGGSVPWITVGPITADNEPYLKDVPEGLTEEGRENSRFIEPHTLLLTNSGATLGVPKITLIGGCINDGVAALLETDYPLKLYLLYFLHTQTTKLRGVNQGAAQPNLNTSIIKAIWAPLPSLAEQEQIVALVEERFSQIDAAAKTIDAELTRAKRLRQSILKRAFEGKLVPQDPSDEPASVLLQRIKASSETDQLKKSRRAGRASK
jgi:type I restriction enzyme S subunit